MGNLRNSLGLMQFYSMYFLCFVKWLCCERSSSRPAVWLVLTQRSSYVEWPVQVRIGIFSRFYLVFGFLVIRYMLENMLEASRV